MCNQAKLILFFVSSSCWNTNPKSWTVWIYRVPIFLMNVVCNKSQRPFCDSVVQGFIFHLRFSYSEMPSINYNLIQFSFLQANVNYFIKIVRFMYQRMKKNRSKGKHSNNRSTVL